MNTFWWRRWKCVYTNIISTTAVILNGRMTRRSDIRTVIVSIGQNQRLIMRRRKNGLSTCVEDQRFDGTGTVERETGRSTLVDRLIVVFSPDDSLSAKIKFPNEIRKAKHMDQRSFQLVWTTSTGGIQIASFRSLRIRARARRKEKPLLCPSFLLTDRSNTAGRSRRSLLIDTDWRVDVHQQESRWHCQCSIENIFYHLVISREVNPSSDQQSTCDVFVTTNLLWQRRKTAPSTTYLSLTSTCVCTFSLTYQ